MKNRNGLYGFELLTGLDDDMIAAAILPDEGGAAVVAKPSRRERLGDFMSNGWVAVILSVVVSLAVLAAIITAGFQAPPVDPVGTDGHETTTPTPETTDLSETTAPLEDDRPELYGLWDGRSIRVARGSDYLTPVGFVTSRIEYASDGTYFVSVPEKNVLELAEERQVELPRALLSAGDTLSITPLSENCQLEGAEIFTPDGAICYEQGSATSLKIDLPAGEYLVAVRAHYRYEDATGDQVDFLFRLTVRPSEEGTPIILTTGRREYPIMGYVRSESYAGSWDGDQTYTQKSVTERIQYIYMEEVYLTIGKAFQLLGMDGEDRLLALEVYEYDSYDSEVSPVQVLRVTENIESADLSVISNGFFKYYLGVLTVEKSTEDSTWVVEYPFRLRPRKELSAPVSSPSERVTLEINGQTVIPNECFSWGSSWDGESILYYDGWYFSDIYENELDILPEIHAPVGSSAAIHIARENGYLSGVGVYDFRGNQVAFGEDLSVLSTLPAGSYCLDLSVRYRGEYVPEYDTETGSGYTCAFILTLE